MGSLPWAPESQTKMQLNVGDNATLLTISVTNMESEPVTIQTRGRQHFLVPHSAFDVTPDDNRPRILDEQCPAPEATIGTLDLSTKEIMRRPRSPGQCGGAQQQHDPRPKLDVLTTLRPSVPLVRNVDISSLLSRLPGGRYGLKMEPRGMWWCLGDCEEFKRRCEDGRVPQDVFQTMIPPLMLKCDNVVEVQIENGAPMMQTTR
ncbi:thioredoxin-like protein [Fusarium flagelliforme]|uniref:Thioredoxin-like protein n=1 Tax=Fusarium flagelliforme TaxID=2675880 RepID=A0A395MM39_9HYPO|nr:thioredoxin-like protein [Fusarium flagelliforme]